MRMSSYLSGLDVNHQGLFISFILLILGVTSFGLSPIRAPSIPVVASESGAEPNSFITTGVGGTGPKLDLDGTAAQGPTIPWHIHFYAVPGADGTSLFVSTGQTADVATNAEAAVNVGGAFKHHGMTYNIEESAYEVLIGGVFTPGPFTAEGAIGLSADLSDGDTVQTPDVPFRRFFVPSTSADPVVSVDNNLEMTLSDNSLSAPAYVLVMSGNASPGPVPLGHQLVGQPYSVRASGATITSMKPMLLKLFYTDITLGEVDPHTLGILQWNPVSREWNDLDGTLDDWIENSVSTTTDRFTVYALMGTTRWRDGFNDPSGLSEREHTDILLLTSELILDGTTLTGTAVSRSITPTVSIGEWGTVSYTKTEPTGTSLTIDILEVSNNVVISDVADGTSLAMLDPNLYPSLKLRANLATDDLTETPRLDEWSITWQPRTCKTYLPLILRL
jgi:hypothetical protein